jgi:TonB family protein
MPSRSRTLVIASAIVIASTSARAQTAPSDPQLAATLALPISPASIALLVGNGADPAAQQRVREGLRDSRPEVRSAAARVVYSAGLQMLLSDLRAALKVEQNPDAAGNEVRALMTFAPGLAPECVAAAGRLGAIVADMVVNTFARLNSAELIPQLSTLEAAHATPGAVQSALQVLIQADETLRDRLLRERASDPIAVGVVLISFRKARQQPADEILLPLLNSDQEAVRQITTWQLARGIASQAFTLSPAIATVVDARVKDNATAVTWEALGLDLIVRAGNRSRHERRWTALPDKGRGWESTEDRILFSPLLSIQESHDLEEVLHLNPNALTKAVSNMETDIYKASRQEDFVVRTVPRFQDGFETELLKLTGCDASRQPMVAGNVAYRPEGRPRLITMVPDERLTDNCKRAALVLFSLTIPRAARPLPSTYAEALILPLEPELVACVDAPVPETPATPAEGFRFSRDVTPPKRTKMVNPTYPPSLLANQREGIVFIEATISPTGCVMNASVVSAPDPLFSGAALFAVMQWRYTPTLIKGNPVPVIMNVTVNFMLHP